MRKAKIAELKNQLSRYLAHVRAGGEVLVFDRDEPVARIIPASSGAASAKQGPDQARLARLERQGLARRGVGAIGRLPRPVRVKGGVLRDLLAERETGW